MTETALVWFRRDLRLRDNPTLAAAADADALVPVYCFDPRRYGTREYGGERSVRFEKTGAHRALPPGVRGVAPSVLPDAPRYGGTPRREPRDGERAECGVRPGRDSPAPMVRLDG